MPLLPNLPYTDLTKLKFGDPNIGDRPGGGWSRQPFITTSGLDVSRISTEDLGRTGGPDMFLRGGYLVPGRVLNDEERLLKLFTKTNTGVLFTAQQNLLSTLGARIYGGYPIGPRIANFARLNDGTYTPLSTAAAIAGNAFGAHPNKQGIDPTGLSNFGRPEYIKLVKGGVFNTGNGEGIADIKNNRLLHLWSDKITFAPIEQSNNALGRFGQRVTNFVDKNLNNPENLYSYAGGPQADKDGLGRTYIKIGGDSPSRQNGGQILKGYGGEGNVRYGTFSQTQIANATVIGNGGENTIASSIQDFRTVIRNGKDIPKNEKQLLFKNGSLTLAPDYTDPKFRIEQRVNIGDPGRRGADRSNYQVGIPDTPAGLDTLNSLYLYKSDNVNSTDVRTNDLVKFRIAVIDNDNPKQKTFIHLRAFIKGFNDGMNASWNEFSYLGRGEKFFNYTGFTRQITMSFTAVAQSVQELSIMYQKLNYLMSHLTPDYSSGGYMRGNLVQLTLGGYLYEVPGVITSLTYNIPDDTTWEIGIPVNTKSSSNFKYNATKLSNTDVKELPHRIEASLTFKPIHEFLPQIVGSSYSKTENPKGIFGNKNIKQRFLSLAAANPQYGDVNLYDTEVNNVFLVDTSKKESQNTTKVEPTPNPRPYTQEQAQAEANASFSLQAQADAIDAVDNLFRQGVI